MRTLAFDLYDAVRSLRRDLPFTAIVTATLALTLGTTTAVFSIVNDVLLQPLRYDEPEQLVMLHETWREFAHLAPALAANERHFDYWSRHATSFAGMSQYLPLPANLTSGGDAAQISVARTSASLFDVLRVRPILGRLLLPADEDADVAVISHGLWQNRFSADAAVVGTAIVLDGKPFTVVGVLPASFRLPVSQQLVASVDAFVPLRVAVGWVGEHNNVAIARLRDGVDLETARAEMAVLQAQVAERASRDAGEPVTLGALVTPLTEAIVGRSRRGLLLLFGAVLGVLFMACSNLAHLSLTRALARTRDGAIRSALGASRLRLVRRVAFEQLLLAVAGGMAGLAVARAALGLLVRAAPIDVPRLEEVAIDGQVVVFAIVVATLSGLAVSLLPAWHLASRDVQSLLRAGGTVIGADRGGGRARAGLLGLQVAISVTLLAVTGLLGLSLLRVLGMDRGFDTAQVIALPLSMPAARYADNATRVVTYDRIIASLHGIPGVTHVSATSLLPFRGEGQVNFIVAAGSDAPRAEQPSANFRFVAPEFFTTLRLPLSAGRSFTDQERDEARPAPVVISASVARRLWPGEHPIGRVFSRGIEGEQPFEVVGVTIDARTTSLEREPPLMVYVPYWWRSRASTALLVRTAGDPTGVVPDIRATIRRIDPDIAVGQAQLLDELLAAATAARRYQAQMFVAFAAVALFIATLGVYAGTAYSVSRRRREMNIRVALGAERRDVVTLVMRQMGAPLVAGAIAGVAGALAIGTLAASLLYDVHPYEPAVLVSVTAVVTVAALAATGTAMRRGLTLDPGRALREG